MGLYTREAKIFVNEHHDNCSVCGRCFIKNETTHIGLDANGGFVYVGDCCKDKIKTLICNHAYCVRGYSLPNPQSKLWRFMDLGKFLSLIQSNSLYFARADMFDDPFEGAKGVKSNQAYWEAWYAGCFWAIIEQTKEMDGKSNHKDDSLESAKRLVRELTENESRSRQMTYINCWHENDFESEAMWNLYTNNLDEGIVIQTTYERIYEAIDKDPTIAIGKVKYIDYANQYAGLGINAFFYKRKSFEHEKEVRLILTKYSCSDKKTPLGIEKHVDLDRLIEKIYVSPTCKPWYYKVISDVLEKYNIKAKLCKSNLCVAPFY